MIKLSLDDGDPWHLSIVPLIIFAIGVALFCWAATFFVLDGAGWANAIALAAGIIASAAGGVGMIREHLAQAAVLEDERVRVEREAGS
jgi:hypothetical protein